MNRKHQSLLNGMTVKIRSCLDSAPTEKEMAANCQAIAHHYWKEIKLVTPLSFFENEANEINFFKRVKPLFTSTIGYFTLLTEALQQVPVRIEDQYVFWMEEMGKCKQFSDANHDFIAYYKRGDDYMDSIYFRQVKSCLKMFVITTPYDEDFFYCSSCDHKVRGMMAYEMYEGYCQVGIDRIINPHRLTLTTSAEGGRPGLAGNII